MAVAKATIRNRKAIKKSITWQNKDVRETLFGDCSLILRKGYAVNHVWNSLTQCMTWVCLYRMSSPTDLYTLSLHFWVQGLPRQAHGHKREQMQRFASRKCWSWPAGASGVIANTSSHWFLRWIWKQTIAAARLSVQSMWVNLHINCMYHETLAALCLYHM